MDELIKSILVLLSKCDRSQKEFVLNTLRKEIPIHPIETKLKTTAELILEALSKDERGLTLRMLRGVIAEAAFDVEVLRNLKGWKNETPSGDLSYDYLMADSVGKIKVQVKLQRSIDLKPMEAHEALKRFSKGNFVVETQKTRRGNDPATNEGTRSYKFGEFDILAVSMQPSTGNWHDFMYTPSQWLLPDDSDRTRIFKFQPVSKQPSKDWTNDFEKAVMWFRNANQNTIAL